MFYKYYPMILGIVDQLNDWDEKLDKFAAEHLDNVGIGTVLFFGLLLFGFFGIATLNKKNR